MEFLWRRFKNISYHCYFQNFKVTSWPREDYGKFFDGDSYIILNVSFILFRYEWAILDYGDMKLHVIYSNLYLPFRISGQDTDISNRTVSVTAVSDSVRPSHWYNCCGFGEIDIHSGWMLMLTRFENNRSVFLSWFSCTYQTGV